MDTNRQGSKQIRGQKRLKGAIRSQRKEREYREAWIGGQGASNGLRDAKNWIKIAIKQGLSVEYRIEKAII